jgi:hypothetical protein
MIRLFRGALLLVAVLALVAGSGCGSDTKTSNDYVKSLNKVQTDFADSVGKTTSASGGKPQDVFTKLGTAIDKLIADLKGVQAPDKVKSLHNDLIAEMTRFKAEVGKAGSALSSGDAAKITAAQTTFATKATAIGTQIEATIQAINKKLQG